MSICLTLGALLGLTSPVIAQAQAVDWRVTQPLVVYGLDDAISRDLTPIGGAVAGGAPDALDRLSALARRADAGGQARKPADEDEAIRQRTRQFWKQGYTIEARLPAGGASLCRWRVAGGNVETAACSDFARLTVQAAPDRSATLPVSVEHDGVTQTFNLAVRYRLVVGMGDSFASGEGNPDRPTDWNGLLNSPGLRAYDWTVHLRDSQYRPAEWTHENCHRSLFSYQLLVAAGLAAADPHQVVGYIALSCSGASIFDGVLQPQAGLPGGGRQFVSQAEELERVLCIDDVLAPSPEIRPVGWRAARTRPSAQQMPRQSCPHPRRSVDLLQLSIGGNDIGFAGVIGWTLGPASGHTFLSDFAVSLISEDRGIVCPGHYKDDPRCRGDNDANANIRELQNSVYPALDRYFDDTPSLKMAQIHQLAYPDPLSSPSAGSCPRVERDDLSVLPDLARYRVTRRRWEVLVSPGVEALQAEASRYVGVRGLRGFGLTGLVKEARDIQSDVIRPLARAVAANDRLGWTPIAAIDASGRGWCAPSQAQPAPADARTEALAERADLEAVWRARWDGRNPVFSAEPLAEPFAAYSPRIRLFRTPNDTALIQMPAQASRDGAFAGAFHPTAEYHLLAARAALQRALQTAPPPPVQ